MKTRARATRVRRLRATLAWALTNVAIGYLAAFPLLLVVVFGYYVRAKVFGTVAAPFRDGEADVPALLIAVTFTPLVVAAVAANRVLRRQLPGWPAPVFWAASTALLLAPFAGFALSGLTVPQMLGKGLFW